MPRVVLHLPEGTPPERLQQLALAMGMMAGGRAEVLTDTPNAPSDPRGILIRKQDDASRFLVLNKLGINMLTLSALEGAMAIVLADCRGVFQGAKTMLCALEAEYPAVWKGQGHQVRQVYAALRKKFAATRYPLTGGKGQAGIYGFQWRLETPTGEAALEVAVDERKV